MEDRLAWVMCEPSQSQSSLLTPARTLVAKSGTKKYDVVRAGRTFLLVSCACLLGLAVETMWAARRYASARGCWDMVAPERAGH